MMRIGSKSIDFELSVDEKTLSVLVGDSLRIKQILNNLLSNAFKYTDKGTVRLSVFIETCDGDADKAILVLNVSDTGQGMTKDQVGKLFDEYSRFNVETNRSTEGTGLGMGITRNLIHMMGGEIFIESEQGVGSTFTVRIPQGKAGGDILGTEMAENLQQFRTSSRAQMKRVQITREPMPYGSVLIVDDVETNIYVARGLLVPYELKIDSAESGFAAIEKIRDGKTYDIIFMDHMMPKMDGVEAARIIRGMGYERPIVALTANAVSGQADIFLGNGFDDYISKPIDIRQLNTILNRLIRDRQPMETIEAVRKNAETKKDKPESGNNASNPDIDRKFSEVFARDALKVLAVLEAISEKESYSNEEDMLNYIINIHGIKSALANIGKMDLSAVALKLEMAGREGKLDIITSETPAFLGSLRNFVEEIVPRRKDAIEAGDEDRAYLLEKLETIKSACGEYDEATAEKALAELKKAEWSRQTMELLDKISEQLLCSDFDETVAEIVKFTAK
jgi:CheY-like chemotaxis protein/anti-sigma regulatory factor (Ser/Thr protein kinase)